MTQQLHYWEYTLKEIKIIQSNICIQISIETLFTQPKGRNNLNIISVWMNKQNVVKPHNGILLSFETEWGTDACYTMDESQKYAEWKSQAL